TPFFTACSDPHFLHFGIASSSLPCIKVRFYHLAIYLATLSKKLSGRERMAGQGEQKGLLQPHRMRRLKNRPHACAGVTAIHGNRTV
ncbi:MAG: hypothetical protein LBU43_10105, partial [Candidatus Accumulibacter sp.]|nr:hypothetical protein [Accumulibacter sp.]